MNHSITFTSAELDVLSLLIHTGMQHEAPRLAEQSVERVHKVQSKIAGARLQPMLALA